MEFDYITQGDCLELMKDIPDGSVDMILCDLPYGTTACKWDSIIPFEPLWEQYKRVIKENGAIVLFGSEPFSTMLRYSNLKNYKYDLIWVKNNAGNFQLCKKQFLKVHENISIFYKKQPTYNPQGLKKLEKPIVQSNKGKAGKLGHLGSEKKRSHYVQRYTNYPRSILYFDRPSKPLHPTQKPVALLEYLIKTYTNEGDIVLDNCMGTGSTCVAAVNTSRHYIGFELSSEYFDIACQRLDEAENKKIFDQEVKEAEQ